MKKYIISEIHFVTVEKANRGIENDYKICFFENGKKLDEEYGTKEYIEDMYDVIVR